MQDADLSALANTTFETSGAILYLICYGYLDPLPVLTPLVGINTKSVFFFTVFSSSFLYTSPKILQPWKMSFAVSSRNLRIATERDGLYLFSLSQDQSGEWQDTKIRLDDFIGNSDGIIFRHCPSLSMIYPLISDTRMVQMGR